MSGIRVGLVGDRTDEVRAHTAIPQAISLACPGERDIEVQWLPTAGLERCSRAELAGYHGIWVVPGSPYASFDGALAAIRFARETGRPFLGTCGGFQHALIEYARNVLGIEDAEHAESNPSARVLLIERLACSLVGARGAITLKSGSLLARAYGALDVQEAYHCNYGLSPGYASRFEAASLQIVGWDEAGSARAVELVEHPFFVATLFQPELSAFNGQPHALIARFLRAVRSFASNGRDA